MSIKPSTDLEIAIKAEIAFAASQLPAPALVPALGFFGDLAKASDQRRATPNMVRRAISRWRLLQRFSRLRSSPVHSRRSNHYIVAKLLDRTVYGVAGRKTCSIRSVEALIQRYNTVGENGLAGGLSALVDGY